MTWLFPRLNIDRMLAGFYEAPGRFQITEVPDPKLSAPDEVLIEVEVAGLCGTDLHIASVPQRHPAAEGIVLGHEFVGRVVEKGPAVFGLAVGQRVIAGPNIWCGQCETCRRGLRKMCRNNVALGITRSGGFARLVSAPARVLYPVPEEVPSEEAVFAEPLSCVMNGFHAIGKSYGDRVAVLGGGPIGLYFTRLFRHFGARRIVVTEPVAHRRAAAERSGATDVVDPTESGTFEALRARLPDGPDLVVDTVGTLLPDALRAVRKGGTVLVFGMDQTASCQVRPFEIVREEKRILGCFVDNDMIPRCLELIPHLGMGELISHRLPLARIDEAMKALDDGTAIKALVFPGA